MRLIGVSIVGLAALASIPFEQPVTGKPAVAPARTAITCTWPVSANDSATSIRRRFGRQARVAQIGTGEGEEEPGIVLFPNDPRRRMEVLFWNQGMRSPRQVHFSGDDAPWSVAGIRMGDTLASLRQRNGQPISLQQFEADYGGMVHNFGGGYFAKALGRCWPSMYVTPTYADDASRLPDSLSGDGIVTSDHPDMPKARAYVHILGIEFPQPPRLSIRLPDRKIED